MNISEGRSAVVLMMLDQPFALDGIYGWRRQGLSLFGPAAL
jgi:hypothetical protein